MGIWFVDLFCSPITSYLSGVSAEACLSLQGNRVNHRPTINQIDKRQKVSLNYSNEHGCPSLHDSDIG